MQGNLFLDASLFLKSLVFVWKFETGYVYIQAR